MGWRKSRTWKFLKCLIKPAKACVRIFAISGAVNFTMLASIPRLGVPSKLSLEQCQKYMKSLNLIVIGLIRLRQYLVSATITTKSDVSRLCVDPRIQSLGEMFDEEISQMCGGTENSETSPLTMILRKMATTTTTIE